MRTYAGIGSRQTPPPVLSVMTRLATAMQHDHVLRSGGAAGADSAFYRGISPDLRDSRSEIFLPDARFNGWTAGQAGLIDSTQLDVWPQALATVDRYHPAPHRLGPFARALMARNSLQLLGPSLDRPADFIVAWTPNGAITGGTGQALRMAADYGVPVRNLGDPAVMQKAIEFLARTGY
jgi:hypothetical protein